MWTCQCGTNVEDEYQSCWNCKKLRPLSKAEKEAAKEKKHAPPEPIKSRRGRTMTLVSESIFKEWAVIVDEAGGHARTVIEDIQRRLAAADIPGGCTWSIETVGSSGLFNRVARDYLVVNYEPLKDFTIFISVRDFGRHLNCSEYITAQGGIIKEMISEKLMGNAQTLSLPKNILVYEDLRAWVTIVHHALIDAIDALVEQLGVNPALFQRGNKGFLEIW